MIEYILIGVLFYFLIGLVVMDGFLSNKYIYEGANIYFQYKRGRPLKKMDYFWMVVLSSYMWPKIAISNLIFKMHHIDKDTVMKTSLEKLKEHMAIEQQCPDDEEDS